MYHIQLLWMPAGHFEIKLKMAMMVLTHQISTLNTTGLSLVCMTPGFTVPAYQPRGHQWINGAQYSVFHKES